MAEGAGLLNQYAGNRIEGSNPSPSANYRKAITKLRKMFSGIFLLADKKLVRK